MTDLAALAAELLPGADPAVVRAAAADRLGARAARPRAGLRRARPGDLVIVPASALAVVAPGPAEVRELAGSLAGVPISGALLVGADPAADGADEALVMLEAALAAASVPLVRLARTDAAALERSVVGFIVARGAELERQASLLEAELRRRALEGGGATALLGAVSSFLGRALALEGGRGEVLAVHAPSEVPRPPWMRRATEPPPAPGAARSARRGVSRRPRTGTRHRSRCASSCHRPPARRARCWCSGPTRRASSRG